MSTDKSGKGSTTVVVFVVQVGSNPKKEAKKSLEAWWQADLHSSEKSIYTWHSLRKQPFLLAFVAEDVSQGIISATQRQKFHTDDVKLFTNDRQKTKGHEGQM